MRSHRFVYVVLVAALGLSSCVTNDMYTRSQAANAALRDQLADMEGHLDRVQAENTALRSRVEDLQVRAADASWIAERKKRLAELIARFESGGGNLQEGSVELVETPTGMAFRVQGGILFEPGQASITAAGRKTLASLVDTLQQQGKPIRVDGHTDSDPITRSQWKSNLHLSAARALAVAEFLIESGLPRERVSVTGFGPNRPAAPGDDDVTKARNRRVEILMVEQG